MRGWGFGNAGGPQSLFQENPYIKKGNVERGLMEIEMTWRKRGLMKTERDFLPIQFIYFSPFPLIFSHFLSLYNNYRKCRKNLNMFTYMHYEEIILEQNSLRGSLTTGVGLPLSFVFVFNIDSNWKRFWTVESSLSFILNHLPARAHWENYLKLL